MTARLQTQGHSSVHLAGVLPSQTARLQGQNWANPAQNHGKRAEPCPQQVKDTPKADTRSDIVRESLFRDILWTPQCKACHAQCSRNSFSGKMLRWAAMPLKHGKRLPNYRPELRTFCVLLCPGAVPLSGFSKTAEFEDICGHRSDISPLKNRLQTAWVKPMPSVSLCYTLSYMFASHA